MLKHLNEAAKGLHVYKYTGEINPDGTLNQNKTHWSHVKSHQEQSAADKHAKELANEGNYTKILTTSKYSPLKQHLSNWYSPPNNESRTAELEWRDLASQNKTTIHTSAGDIPHNPFTHGDINSRIEKMKKDHPLIKIKGLSIRENKTSFKNFIEESKDFSDAVKSANEFSSKAFKKTDRTKLFPSISSHQDALSAHNKAIDAHYKADSFKDETCSASSLKDVIKKHSDQARVHQNYIKG